MENLNEYVLNANKAAREAGYANAFTAFLERSGKSLENYMLMKRSFDEYFADLKRHYIPKKRRRFLAAKETLSKILAAVGIDCEGIDIILEENLSKPFADIEKREVHLPLVSGNIDLKSAAHEIGHLAQNAKAGELLAVDSEIYAMQYEFKLLEKLCDGDVNELRNIKLDRIFSNLYRAESKRFLFETEDFQGLQKKMFGLRSYYDLARRWQFSPEILDEGFSEICYLYGLSAVEGLLTD